MTATTEELRILISERDALRAENAELVAALVSTASMLNDVIGADSADRTLLGEIETGISSAIAKHRGEK